MCVCVCVCVPSCMCVCSSFNTSSNKISKFLRQNFVNVIQYSTIEYYHSTEILSKNQGL